MSPSSRRSVWFRQVLGPNLFFIFIVLVLLWLILFPIGQMILNSFRTGHPAVPGPFTLQNYLVAYTSPLTYRMMWNTFVFVARVTTLLAAAQQFLPALNEGLARVASFACAEGEAWAVQQAYASMAKEDFSRSILEPCPSFLAVATLPALTWCDLGTPGRVLRTLKRMGV